MSKLTKSAEGQPCIKCQRTGETRACHYNGWMQHQYGKGRGIKASDIATAEFCQECDTMFTEGSTEGFTDKIDRSEQFLHFIMLTNISRYKRGDL